MELRQAINILAFKKIPTGLKILFHGEKCTLAWINGEATRSQPHFIANSVPRKISAENIWEGTVRNDAFSPKDKNLKGEENAATSKPT